MFGIGKKEEKQTGVMDEDSAKLELDVIAEAFEITISDEHRVDLMPAVIAGRLYLKDDKIVYKLARPTDKLSSMEFDEPTGGQAEKCGKGVKAQQRGDVTEIDIGEAAKMTTNLASAMSGVPITTILEMKNRDKKIVDIIVGFFK